MKKNPLMGYYWELKGEDHSWVFDDPLDGFEGIRKELLLPLIENGEKVLDIGCGIGTIYEILRRNNKQASYLGIDCDQEYLDEARKFFPQIQTRLTDMNFLPFEDNSFDTSILFTVIECIADFRKAIDEAWRVSKKKVVITVSVEPTNRPDENAWGVTNPPFYIVRINKDRLENYMKQYTTHITDGTWYYNGRIEYWYYVMYKDESDRHGSNNQF